MTSPAPCVLIPDDTIEAGAGDRLRAVHETEIDINLIDPGLIYDLTAEQGEVHVTMTLTAPGSPMSDSMPLAVQRVIEMIPGVTEVGVDLVNNHDPKTALRPVLG